MSGPRSGSYQKKKCAITLHSRLLFMQRILYVILADLCIELPVFFLLPSTLRHYLSNRAAFHNTWRSDVLQEPSFLAIISCPWGSNCAWIKISLCATPAFFADPGRLFHLELILNFRGGQNGEAPTDLNISMLSMRHFTRVHPQFTLGSIPICRDWV